ncbi:DUF6879 family protein [Yinghuangia soli]|uniref:DUF6879 domain-containing protein n=1 Tax=Yinghuangia soli TaxID=2908204 RepID=A0AA41U3K5_9ACTN|nr:DUF6879 family protein [Yinghuangia soli]MCF2529817.1 hypothetical protein [Yinghuangia soli]
MLTGDDFARLFAEFEREAFRLETLSAYDVEDEQEEFAAFLAGEPMPPEWSDNPWVRAMTDRGKAVARVHVLRSPWTDYLRYELSAYPGNVKAGESIGIIDLADHVVPGLPDHDFWLFDNASVYRMHYTEAGRFVGAEPLPVDRVAEYRGYRDVAQAHAEPFAVYWERHRQT